jgi:hypothetical protein
MTSYVTPKPQRYPLPGEPGSSGRWIARAKAALLGRIDAGDLTEDAAIAQYGLSAEELDAWRRRVNAYGVEGLMVSRAQRLRVEA